MRSAFQKSPLALAIISLASHASGAEPTIEEVMIWGTEVRSSSVNLDTEALAIRQPEHISQLLRPIPGVDVGGAHSLNQRITLRSMDDKDIRVTIDGANQNTYMYHHMGNLQIHADILKSVDVDVGNNSVVNGGLGGVVRFETKDARDLLRPDQGFGAHLQARVTDNASNHYALSLYGQLSDTVDGLLYSNYIDRENYRVGGDQILDQQGQEIEGTDGEVRGLAGELTDTLAKFNWRPNENHRLRLGYETYADEGDYSYRPDMGLATDLTIAGFLDIPLVYPTRFTRDTYTLNYDATLGAHTDLRAALFRNESTLWRDEQGLASWSPADATINEGDANNTGLNILASSSFGSRLIHNLNYGLDVIQYETTFATGGEHRAGEEATSSALFLEDRIDVGNFSLRPGVRYEHYDLDGALTAETFEHTNFALAAEYEIMNRLLLSASATQLFKGPEVAEVFAGAGLNDVPNPDIEAETGINKELAAAYQGDYVSAGLTVFRTELDDYIFDYAPHPTARTWKDNVGDMTIEGFETYLEYEYRDFRALLTYASAESELAAFEQYQSLDGARLDRQQGDSVSVSFDYEITPIDLALNWGVQWVDDLEAGPDLDGATLDNAKSGYTVHNVSARWTPGGASKGLSLTLGVDNVFDEFYASQSSRTGTSRHPLFGELYLVDYEPGRNIKATVAYRF